MAAVAPTDLFSARAIFPNSIFFWASPLSLRISVAVHGRSPVEFFVIHVSLNIPPHGGGYLVHVLRSFHARRNQATRKKPRIVSPARKLVACVAGKCEFAAPGQSCIRAGERRIAPPALRLAPLFERYAKPVFFSPNDATMTPALIDLHNQHEFLREAECKGKVEGSPGL